MRTEPAVDESAQAIRLKGKMGLAIALLGQKDEEVRYLKRIIGVIAENPSVPNDIREMANLALRESTRVALGIASPKLLDESSFAGG